MSVAKLELFCVSVVEVILKFLLTWLLGAIRNPYTGIVPLTIVSTHSEVVSTSLYVKHGVNKKVLGISLMISKSLQVIRQVTGR